MKCCQKKCTVYCIQLPWSTSELVWWTADVRLVHFHDILNFHIYVYNLIKPMKWKYGISQRSCDCLPKLTIWLISEFNSRYLTDVTFLISEILLLFSWVDLQVSSHRHWGSLFTCSHGNSSAHRASASIVYYGTIPQTAQDRWKGHKNRLIETDICMWNCIFWFLH